MAPVLAASAARALSNFAAGPASAGTRSAGSAVALASAPAPGQAGDDGPSVELSPRNDDILPAKGKSFFRFRR